MLHRIDTGIPRGIGVIAIDPFDSKHLLIGGVGFAEVSAEEDSLGGLYTSNDSGVKLEARNVYFRRRTTGVTRSFSIPTKRGVVFADFHGTGIAQRHLAFR